MLVESLVVGFAVGFLIYEFYGVSPGGVVTPAYIALNIRHPENILSTILLAILVFYLLKSLAGYLIIFGKRRLLISILLGLLFKLLIDSIFWQNTPINFDIHTIGFLIPGLIANEIYRQGIVSTILSMLAAALLTALILLVVIG